LEFRLQAVFVSHANRLKAELQTKTKRKTIFLNTIWKAVRS